MQGFVPADGYKTYHAKEYFNVLAEIVMNRARAGATIDGAIPKVRPEEQCSQEVCTQRREMLHCMTKDSLRQVELGVEEQWAKERSGLPEAIRATFAVKPPQAYWVVHYYPVMFALFGSTLGDITPASARMKCEFPSQSPMRVHACGSDDGSGSAHATASRPTAPMLARVGGYTGSMKAKPTVLGMESILSGAAIATPTPASAVRACEFFGSVSLQEDSLTGTHWKVEGFLIEHDESPRMLANPPKKRGGAGDSENVALDCLLADKTGPISVSLWGEAVHSFLTLLNQRGFGNADSTPRPLVLFEGVRIQKLIKSQYHGDILTPMKVVHSTPAVGMQPGTKVFLPTAPTSPFTTTRVYQAPSLSFCISEYVRGRSQLVAPFRATFRGMVVDVQAEDVSRQGKPKLLFDLVDDAGTWLSFCAMGRSATSPALTDGNDVVVYHGTARPAFGSSSGLVYLFKDAMVVQLGVKAPRVEKRTQLSIDIPATM